MRLNPHCRIRLGLVVLFLWSALGLRAGTVRAEDLVPRYLQFMVQDQDGHFFPMGEVELCTPDGNCQYADIKPDFPGHFFFPSARLQPGVAYTVRIYDLNVAVLYEMRNWVYAPRDYDPSFDRLVDEDKFLVYPRFQGQPDGGLTFQLDTTLNPEWLKKKNLPRFTGPDSLPDFPRLVAGFQIPVMLGGKFRTDLNALGGVDDVRPGMGLFGAYRFGYPRHLPPRDGWVFFQELLFSYQQNRYETWEVITPGRRSDVTFHRVKISYGLGRMNASFSSHWSVGLTAAAGGIYDGSQILKYLGRTYRRTGVGLRATGLQKFFQVGRVDVGLSAQLELMYYFADNGPDDFWFGTAPSASLGLVVY